MIAGWLCNWLLADKEGSGELTSSIELGDDNIGLVDRDISIMIRFSDVQYYSI